MELGETVQGKKLFDTKGKAPVVGIRVRPETLERLQSVADKEELTLSDLLRIATDLFLDDPRGSIAAFRKRHQGVAELKVMDNEPTKREL